MTYIELKTEIPGPKARAILQRRAASVTNSLAKATDVVVASAQGALVHDVDGNTLIDLAGGIGALAVGHCPPTVVSAMQSQAEKLLHFCAIVGTYEPYVELCELLNEITPGDFPKKSLLANTGTESVENAIKLARAYTGRAGVICFEGAYHGRTMLAMTLTSKYSLFKKKFGPFAPEIYRLPAPYLFRRPLSMSEQEYVDWHIYNLENALISQVDPSELAAIIIEPVQGEAGFLPMPAAFLRKIRQICDQHGVVFIADEVQCGMGRTGRLFAIEHYDLVPDLIVTAKSMGAGMPLSAVTGRAEIMDASHPGGMGGTYTGNPLTCVAGVETIKILRSPEFMAKAAHTAEVLHEVMTPWLERYPMVGDVRGLGPMMLVEFVGDRETKTPIPAETLAIIKRSAAQGVVLIRAGLYSNCIRLMPPLDIPEDMLREALGVLEASIAHVQAGLLQPA
jgi:4-aminobutyrate aminotransferase/(S)-3-amino-2-methylpropionate transaminase